MQAGFAKLSITPPIGAPLAGFIARLGPSKELDLPLMARALWLRHEDESVLLIGLDLLYLEPPFVQKALEQIAEATGMEPEQIILACSHTHAGPLTAPMRGVPEPDAAYVDHLLTRLVDVSIQAQKTVTSARLRYGQAPAAIGINRRQVLDDGTVVLGEAPERPRDECVRFVEVKGLERPLILFHHACHPYCVGGDTAVISPDFFGHAAQRLDLEGYESIYLNGCAGDLSPVRAFEGIQAAREEGTRLAEAILAGLGGAREMVNPTLAISVGEISLPLDIVPEPEELRRQLDEPDRTVRPEEQADARVQERLHGAWNDWLRDLNRALQEGPLDPVRARLAVCKLGPVNLVTLPGEIFYALGQQIAGEAGGDMTMVAGYCHGYIGYVPSPEAYPEGGYEVNESHRYLGLWRFSPVASVNLGHLAITLMRTMGDPS